MAPTPVSGFAGPVRSVVSDNAGVEARRSQACGRFGGASVSMMVGDVGCMVGEDIAAMHL